MALPCNVTCFPYGLCPCLARRGGEGVAMSELWRLPASELAAQIRGGAPAAEVVTQHLARVDAINPRLNALVQRSPSAVEEAARADAALARGRPPGSLHGIPFTANDLFDAAGLIAAVGLEHRRRHAPDTDATAVARLKVAGAILLGKANCPPGGSGGDTENTVYGRTFNPHRLECTPGGGSGADAALVAVGAASLALSSDAGGTLRLSAHYCGVAGLKPTAGRVPNTGAYNQPGGLSDPFTQVGLLARRVADLALAFPLICGPDHVDAGVTAMPLAAPAAVCLNELTVAYCWEDRRAPVTDATAHTVGAVAQALARAGVRLEEAQPPNFVGDSRGIWENWGNLASLRGQDVVEVLREIDHYRSRLLHFMQRYDAVLCPVDTHPAPPYKVRDPHRFAYTRPFSLTGWPVAVVRAGAAPDGLPIGVQLAARPWREDVALALAAAVERELGSGKVISPPGD